MPSFTSLKARRADSAAITISHTASRPSPPPIAVPFTRATTGAGKRSIESKTSANCPASHLLRSSVAWIAACIIGKSAPALNDLPAPVRITPASCSSRASSAKAAFKSESNCELSALCTSGRFIVSVAMRPLWLCSTSTVSYVDIRIAPLLHAEDAEGSFRQRRVQRGRDTQGQHRARIAWIDDTIVPQAGCAIVRIALRLVLFQDRAFKLRLLLRRHLLAARGQTLLAHRCQHACRLLAAHHRNACIGPHPELAGRIGASAHTIVARAERAADNHREAWYRRVGDRHHHLGAIFGDAAVFVLLANHKAGNILQKDQRSLALGAEFDKVRGLERAFGEENTVIGDNTDGIAHQACKAADQRRTVELLKFVETAAVHQACNDLAHIVAPAAIAWDDAIQLGGIVERRFRLSDLPGDILAPVEIRHDLAADRHGVFIVDRVVLDHALRLAVDIGPAQLLGSDVLAGCGLDQ